MVVITCKIPKVCAVVWPRLIIQDIKKCGDKFYKGPFITWADLQILNVSMSPTYNYNNIYTCSSCKFKITLHSFNIVHQLRHLKYKRQDSVRFTT